MFFNIIFSVHRRSVATPTAAPTTTTSENGGPHSQSEHPPPPPVVVMGPGRSIPVRQGYLSKRSGSKAASAGFGGLREWRKKYVALCADGRTLTYHPSLHVSLFEFKFEISNSIF